jgi:predicted lysophospholipase L1 biosynthesis ABC-type transport system permease subunit
VDVVGQAVFPPLAGEVLLADTALFTPEGLRRAEPAVEDRVLYVVGDAEPGVARRLGFTVERGRGTDLQQLDEIRLLPIVLSVFVGAVGAVALAHVLVASVRRRRADLAVLRALGVTPAGSRSIVRWQACTSVVLGVAIGVPVGILAGTLAWRFEANRLGIATDVAAPTGALSIALVATAIVAGACSALPARRAARMRPAEILRGE